MITPSQLDRIAECPASKSLPHIRSTTADAKTGSFVTGNELPEMIGDLK